MLSIQRFWRRVLEDFKARRNLEVYVVSVVALILALLTLIGDGVPEQFKTAAILAALSLLVLNLSTPERSAGSLDDFLNDRASLGSFEERIKGARELWIYAPAAANILRGGNSQAIRREILEQADGKFLVIVQNPARAEAVDILRRQLDEGLDYADQELPAEIQATLTALQSIRSKWKIPGKFDYRLLDFSPGFSLVVVNPTQKDGVVIVEMHGFHNESTDKRMHIEITRASSERWYDYWTSQFLHMWEKANPPVDATTSTTDSNQ